MVNTCFVQTGIQTSLRAELLVKAAHYDHWIDYFNFKLMPVDLATFQKDSFLRQLNELHPFQAGVLLLPPTTYYDWHVDDERGVCINALLNDSGRSFCCFSPEKITMSGSFIELPYTMGEYVIFNNQVRHTVFNFDKERYLFTVEFFENKELLNYERLVKSFFEEIK